MSYNEIIASLDIGSAWIVVAVGELGSDNRLHILACSTIKSAGVRQGVVINIEAAVERMQAAVSRAEEIAERKIDSFIVNIGGKHVEGFNSRGVVSVEGQNREVSESDVQRVIKTARAITLPVDKQIIHVISRYYMVDNRERLNTALHAIGSRLDAEIHVLTASVVAGQQLVQCVNRAGFHVEDVVFSGYAASLAVLSDDERSQGVLFLNIGHETTEAVIFLDGTPLFCTVLAVGGATVSSDIAKMLNTPLDEAEEIKHEFGLAHSSLLQDNAEPIIVLQSANKKPVRYEQHALCEIIQARMMEIMLTLSHTLKKKRLLSVIGGGVVLSGGATQLPGIAELAHDVFNMPTRIGIPSNYGGKNRVYQVPSFSTSIGLLLYKCYVSNNIEIEEKGRPFVQNVKKWFRNFF